MGYNSDFDSQSNYNHVKLHDNTGCKAGDDDDDADYNVKNPEKIVTLP